MRTLTVSGSAFAIRAARASFAFPAMPPTIARGTRCPTLLAFVPPLWCTILSPPLHASLHASQRHSRPADEDAPHSLTSRVSIGCWLPTARPNGWFPFGGPLLFFLTAGFPAGATHPMLSTRSSILIALDGFPLGPLVPARSSTSFCSFGDASLRNKRVCLVIHTPRDLACCPTAPSLFTPWR